jgi:hypothetical protein
MTRLEQLISLVAQNKHTQTDIEVIRAYPRFEVELAVYFVCSMMPYTAIQNINQANVWGTN